MFASGYARRCHQGLWMRPGSNIAAGDLSNSSIRALRRRMMGYLNEIEDSLSQVSGSLIVDGVASAQQEQRSAWGIHHKTGQCARVREDLHEDIVVFRSRGQKHGDGHGQVTGAGLPWIRIQKTEKCALQPHAPMPLAERGTIDFASLQTRSRHIKLFAGLPIIAVPELRLGPKNREQDLNSS